jgi:hypothetical protein
MGNNLQLSLKTKWFEMTKAGIKTEDYREINLYWFNRLVFQPVKVCEYLGLKNDNDVLMTCKDSFWSKRFGFKPFESNIMTLGYPSKENSERILKLEHKGIEIGTGNPEWGAEPNKLYFIIKHGKQITPSLPIN